MDTKPEKHDSEALTGGTDEVAAALVFHGFLIPSS
jgi:hypothetical protein